VIKLYDPLIKLLTHKHTCKLFKRQAEAVKKIVRLRKNGLYFSDLVPVRVIMQHLIDSVISHGQDAVLGGTLASLISLHAMRFLKSTARDELEGCEEIVENFRLIGSALQCNSDNVQIAVAQTVSGVLAKREKKDFFAGILVQCRVIDVMLEWLDEHKEEETSEVMLIMADTFCKLSANKICTKQLGGYFLYTDALLSHGFNSKMASIAVETIWNLLENNDEVASIFGTQSNVCIVSDLLTDLLETGYHVKDKELRNEVLVVLRLLAAHAAAVRHVRRVLRWRRR
jgi:hypothetical protein